MNYYCFADLFSMGITTSFKTEYWFHVSDQQDIPIFGQVERSIDIDLLQSIVESFPEDDSKREYIRQVLVNHPNSVDLLRAFVGVSDKRMYLELSYRFAKEKPSPESENNVLGYSLYDLKKHQISYFKNLLSRRDELGTVASSIIADYLISKGLFSILVALKSLEFEQLPAFVDSLISPKEVQQAETKRRGHGAEQQFAILLHELGVSYLPVNKHINPMGAEDPNVNKTTFELSPRDENTTWSFDVIIKDNNGQLKIFTQGLIHTSDPGQYGVNKSGETVSIKSSMLDFNNRSHRDAELWGLVDGVGFIENPDNTIFKMLAEFDTFVQLKSLYKAALRLHKIGIVRVKAIRFDMDFYSQQEADDMFAKYGSQDIVKITDNREFEGQKIQAGKAWIYI